MCLVWLLYKNLILLKGLFYLKTRVEIAVFKPAMGSVCQNPQNFHLFFRTQWPGPRASAVIIEFRSTPFDLFSFKLVFEHSKSESQPDVSVTRIGYSHSFLWFSADWDLGIYPMAINQSECDTFP